MDQGDDDNRVWINDQLDDDRCGQTGACKSLVERNRKRLTGRFIGEQEVAEKQILAAVLILKDKDYETYVRTAKKRSKGVASQAKRAGKNGYYCKPFVRAAFVPDIVDINQSKDVRSGGAMKAAYLKSVEEMGGYPKRHADFELPACPCHYDIWWGIFKSEPGYKQGEVITDEKLLAYIDLRRIGNYGLYSLIIGHGDYLKDGVMYALHLAVVEWLLQPDNPHGQGLEYLVYAGFKQGGEGLQQWKRKFGFEGAYLLAPAKPADEANAPANRQCLSGNRSLSVRTPYVSSCPAPLSPARLGRP